MRETAAELIELQAIIHRSHASAKIDAIFQEHYESSPFDWSEHGVYVQLDADRFYTYSRTPDAFPG